MTLERKAKLFAQLFRMLGSNHRGEAAAALEKLNSLRAKMGWPSWEQLLEMIGSSVTAAQLEAAMRAAAQWQHAHATLARENAVLRSALWAKINWRMLAGAAVALTVAAGAPWAWSTAQAHWAAKEAEKLERAALAAAALQRQQAEDAAQRAALQRELTEGLARERAKRNSAFEDLLSRTRWGHGDTAPTIHRINDTPYWVIARGTIDAKSTADAKGRPIELHCLALHADVANGREGAWAAPRPYYFGEWMRWDEFVAECRMPGARNYR